MTIFDLIVLALIAASFIAGALRGFVRALIATLAMFVGLFLAARSYETAGAWLRATGIVESQAATNAGGFLLIVVVFLALGFVVGHLLKGSLRRARLEWMDRALGALFGLARGVAFCSVVYLALTAFPLQISSVTEARTAPVLAEGARLLAWLTSTDIHARFQPAYKRLTT